MGAGREITSFGTMTGELGRIAEWLKARQVESVGTESTGIYWIAPHEVLEGQGLQVLLVDTRRLARGAGRDKKTDPTSKGDTAEARRDGRRTAAGPNRATSAERQQSKSDQKTRARSGKRYTE